MSIMFILQCQKAQSNCQIAWKEQKTRKMSPPWILRRLAIFFNSLSNRLRITNYCLRSVSSSLLKFTRFIQGNNIIWTNLDMIRNLQHLHMNKKSYTYKTLPFNSHWIFVCKLAQYHSIGMKFKLDQ